MRAELLQMRQASLESVRYAADRVDDKVKCTDDALKTVLAVPRDFLPLIQFIRAVLIGLRKTALSL